MTAKSMIEDRGRVLSELSLKDRAIVEEIAARYPKLFHAIGRL
jgi:hypothetical protein